MRKNIIKALILLFLINILPSFADETKNNAVMQEYNVYIQDTIYNNFNQKDFMKQSYDVELSFIINKDGTCKDIDVSNTDSTELKNALIEAVQKSSPFKKIPENTPYDYIKATYTFQNTYNEKQIRGIEMGNVINNSSSYNADYEKYSETVQSTISQAFPTSYSWFTKNAKFKIGVRQDGTIYGIKIIKSSGSKRYDARIVKVIMKQKLPPFPKSINEKRLVFNFNINKNFQFYPIIIPRF